MPCYLAVADTSKLFLRVKGIMDIQIDRDFASRIKQVIDSVPKRSDIQFGVQYGVSHTAVHNWVYAKNKPTTAKIVEICEAEGISEAWLLHGIGSMKDVDGKLSRARLDNSLGNAAFKISTLPIMVARDCGDGRLSVLHTDVFERIQMPPNLVGHEEAYGLYVGGSAMSPAFRYGDTALVDPALPFSSDMEVVIYRDGEDCNAIICTLVAFSESEWTVEVLKPTVQQMTLLRTEWTRCHRIVGKNARR